MSAHIISYEQACEMRNLHNLDIKSMPIFKEADENGLCELLASTSSFPNSIEILVKDDLDVKNAIGYVITVYKDSIDIWIAYEIDGNIHAGLSVCKNLNINTSLSECIAKAKVERNICPVCRKEVPYKDQHRFSFAGRCCQDCLPAMKAKYEQPGWYN